MSLEGTINIFDNGEYNIKLLGFALGILILGVTCFIDDIKNLPPLVKLAGQILAAIVAVASGIRIEHLN